MESKGYYHIITYGCQMNEHDSERLAGQLRDLGYTYTSDYTVADVVILNTCSVRENAELKVFGKVGELKSMKRRNPDMIIGICGCMMQQDQVVDELLKKYPHVDIIFGTYNIHRLGELIKDVQAKKQKRVVDVWDKAPEFIPEMPSERTSPFQAWVSIILGCNNFCTYCIVPYVRGRERSRRMEDILTEVKRLVADGVIEITLLGQNVNSYGKDLKEGYDFSDLLRALDGIEGLARIRYMTSHPRDFSDKLIETIGASKKVCEHFHLPVQSGSTRILQQMNRGYTQESYLELVRKIRQTVPDCSITTDFIVGFPGESEEDFLETLKVDDQVEFDAAYTFLYSQRTGTPAAKYEEQVLDEVKKERLQRLMDLQALKSLKQNQKLLTMTLEILVEGPSKSNPERFQGRTRTNKIILFERGEEDLTGKLVHVRVDKVQSWNLYGEVVEQLQANLS